MMTNLWKFLYYSPKKAELLKEIQAVLNLPELKIVKPSETRWLSHERCVRAICKELPALIKTCQQLHESGGDAEALGLSVLLASRPVIKFYGLTLQRKSLDISRIPSLLQIFLAELEGLREATAEWCSKASSLASQLEKEYNLTLSDRRTRSNEQVECIQEFRRRKAIPYLDYLIVNIRSRFKENSVKVLTAFSILNPHQYPSVNDIASYGLQEIKVLADFYGSNATVEFDGTIFTSPPLLDQDELISE